MSFACPLCQGPTDHWLTMPVDPKKETPIAHGKAYRCRACSFGAILPRPSAQEVAGFYELDSYYTQGRSHLADSGRLTRWDAFRFHIAWRLDHGRALNAERVHELLGGRASDVCDIGCGGGELAGSASELGHRVVGVELDLKSAEGAQARGVELHRGTAEDLPEAVASRRFDLVVMSHVLEHCLDPVRAFANASGLLKPGGLFVCEVPNNASAGMADATLAWEPLDIPRHVNFFVPDNLVTLSERSGLGVKSLEYDNYCRQFGNEWIDTERRIWDAIARSGGETKPSPVKNSKARAWGLLARTALAGKSVKYDAVRVVAQRPGAPLAANPSG